MKTSAWTNFHNKVNIFIVACSAMWSIYRYIILYHTVPKRSVNKSLKQAENMHMRTLSTLWRGEFIFTCVDRRSFAQVYNIARKTCKVVKYTIKLLFISLWCAAVAVSRDAMAWKKFIRLISIDWAVISLLFQNLPKKNYSRCELFVFLF